VFLEVFDGVARAGLLDVGEGCCQLGWGAVCFRGLCGVLDGWLQWMDLGDLP
jgi:hypothetical protein